MALNTNVLNYAEQELFPPQFISDMLEPLLCKGVSGQ
jgi:hypothetical protein